MNLTKEWRKSILCRRYLAEYPRRIASPTQRVAMRSVPRLNNSQHDSHTTLRTSTDLCNAWSRRRSRCSNFRLNSSDLEYRTLKEGMLWVYFCFHVSSLFNKLDQDERAKRERDKVKWNTLMEEIAKLKLKVSFNCSIVLKHLLTN